MIVVSVKADLIRPAVIDGAIHLDALLTSRHPAMHGMGETLTRTSGVPRIAPLPLSVARAGGSWIWCASAWSPPQADGLSAMTKRRDGVDYRMTLRPVYPSVGPDRDRLVRFSTTNGPIEFVAAVPDEWSLKEMRRLLRRIKQIGGKRKSGYGVVSEWIVDAIDAPPELCLSRNGTTRRVLPAEMWDGLNAPAPIALLPPYWQTGELRMGFDYGSQGRLCSGITITSPDTRR